MKQILKDIMRFVLGCIWIAVRLWIVGIVLLCIFIVAGSAIAEIATYDHWHIIIRGIIYGAIVIFATSLCVGLMKLVDDAPEFIRKNWQKLYFHKTSWRGRR